MLIDFCVPAHQHHDDTELIRRCLGGDGAAWRTIVERYTALVYSVPMGRGLARDLCDDVFQGVFLLLLRNLGAVRDHGSLAKWLIVTARNESTRVSAAAGRQGEVRGRTARATPHAEDSPQAEVERLERRQRVWAAMDRLEPRCRELLMALFAGGEKPDYAQVAKQLGMPVGSIGPTRGRCLGRLVELLREDDRS